MQDREPKVFGFSVNPTANGAPKESGEIFFR